MVQCDRKVPPKFTKTKKLLKNQTVKSTAAVKNKSPCDNVWDFS